MRRVFRFVVALGAAGLMWSGLPAGLASASASAVQAATIQQQYSGLLGCVKALQGQSVHPMTVDEAHACQTGIPEIQRSVAVNSTSLPHLFLAIDGTRAIIASDGVGVSADPANAAYAGCYNTWTYPSPWSTDVVSVVHLYVAGYGNHCGYSNVPGNPTMTVACGPCSSVDQQVGHYDSTYGLSHYNQNYAAGWGNAQMHMVPFGIETWTCRGYVDTNGAQNPGGWCL